MALDTNFPRVDGRMLGCSITSRTDLIWLNLYNWCSKLGSTSISASVPTSVQNGTLGVSDYQSSEGPTISWKM